MTLAFTTFAISKINNSSTNEDSKVMILCDEHHPFEKGYFKSAIRAFGNSIKLGLMGNSRLEDAASIFQDKNIPHDLTTEELRLQLVCMAFSWFIFGLFIACLLLCITLVLTSRYPGENENKATEVVPSSNIDDEEKQLSLSDMI
ncbi:BPK_HP2_G0048800.mRNA.1.CDS.1 [Saccharomyces cerevisiae]|nr:hypothetical protein H810_YJM1399O00349 [Saccharomyces cerevisiae YJM1399]CAI4766160.1 CPA_1a_G0051240.mRNA.1.CDS.1 [Saccharomyces cerevisiae]CAI4774447.1 CPI_1c_G0050330.mRNA.1.CDS.1 [Saccharomyces cerevisiae]CAI4789964.1 BBM_1a_G0050320.mRNA.1.CDS.1 [Saccharomyces cerevisiae]CAI4799029.1 BCE_3a_G0050690.mRNA.1.CDS.1 [Saccharomyces cerevisiae]